MGFGDIQLARLTTPELTTVNQFQHDIGRMAASMLSERLTVPSRDTAGRSREVRFELVPRQSG